jgi:hypothetical protein
MIAEAKVRNGQDGQAEYDLVHQREAIAMMSNCEPRQATLENIYYERWIELMWEGWHRNDMIRFGQWTGHTTVFPIPQDMLLIHNDWKQNDGY